MSKLLSETKLNQDGLMALSERLDEPAWIREKRQNAWERAQALDLPQARYTQLRGLEIEKYAAHTLHAGKPDLSSTPAVVSELLSGKSNEDAFGVQLDSSAVQFQLPEALRKQGVIFCDLNAAAREHEGLLKKYLMQDLFKLQTKLHALHAAFWSGGVFLYVPKDVQIEAPLNMLFLHRGAHAGLFTHTVIVAERGSKLTYMEENYALDRQAGALHTAGVEVFLMEGAKVQYGGIQNWNEQTYSFGSRRARIAKDATMDWTLGWLGGRLVVAQLYNELAGPGALAHDVQMAYSHNKQHFDISSNLVHQVPDTKGEVRVRSVLRDRSRSVFSGLIRIESGAQRSDAYQSHRALILNDGARSDSSPSLEINANDVRCTHAASASQLDDEKLFYLRSRGLDEVQAKKAIVDGFFQPTVDNITMELARQRLERLIDEKWEKDEA